MCVSDSDDDDACHTVHACVLMLMILMTVSEYMCAYMLASLSVCV
jgi:hypothetical protein